jgi:uncharacterized protein YbjT (DUF2867 family)
LERGYCVRVLARDASRLAARPWREQVEVCEGDVGDADAVRRALDGAEVAYYLVHSMQSDADFAARDRRNAAVFADAARAAGVRHVIYLGGLLPKGGAPSLHLSSRAEVGQILREATPCTEFRAGPIIGSGSASFEMVRYLTERLPIMVTPRWIDNLVSPIGIRDVLRYLVACAERAPMGVVEIGAPPLSFRAMMQIYAETRGLKRGILKTPVLAPKLAALWVGLVTPIPNRIAVPLVEGIVRSLVADTTRAQELFPDIQPMSYREAVELALTRISERAVETHWSGALGAAHTYTLEDWEGLIREVRSVLVERAARSGVPRVLLAWRRHGLAGVELGVATARADRQARRRTGLAPRATPPLRTAARRGGGLLARGGGRAQSSAAPARRDEDAWQGVAGVRGDSRRRAHASWCRPRCSSRAGYPARFTGMRSTRYTA